MHDRLRILKSTRIAIRWRRIRSARILGFGSVGVVKGRAMKIAGGSSPIIVTSGHTRVVAG